MPVRRSNTSIVEEDTGLGVEDLNLPKTMVNRLAKGALPPNFNVQSVAQAAISKSATVFVNYLTAHASDIAIRQNKKTIQPKDVLDALRELEFHHFVDRTASELTRYQEIQCSKRNTYRRRVKDEKHAAGGFASSSAHSAANVASAFASNSSGYGVREEDGPLAKKARVENVTENRNSHAVAYVGNGEDDREEDDIPEDDEDDGEDDDKDDEDDGEYENGGDDGVDSEERVDDEDLLEEIEERIDKDEALYEDESD